MAKMRVRHLTRLDKGTSTRLEARPVASSAIDQFIDAVGGLIDLTGTPASRYSKIKTRTHVGRGSRKHKRGVLIVGASGTMADRSALYDDLSNAFTGLVTEFDLGVPSDAGRPRVSSPASRTAGAVAVEPSLRWRDRGRRA